MYTLVIDTSFSPSFFALVEGKNLLVSEEIPSKETTRHLLPSIIKNFARFGISIEDIVTIAICNGPGSYTGTRTGVMTAKALAFHNNIQLIPYHSLLPYSGYKAPPILDAKRGRCLTLIEGKPTILPYSELSGVEYVSPEPEIVSKCLPKARVMRAQYDFSLIIDFLSLRGESAPLVTNYL